jgi:heme oxygenase (biliverdin-producing, ferredoxin)
MSNDAGFAVAPGTETRDEPGDAPRFSAALRDRTATIHRAAERTGFIADLIRGRATRAGYARYLRNLLPIYDTLEAALATSPFPAARVFADERLRRVPRLLADLQAIGGDGETNPPIAEAVAYQAAVREAARDERLLAHAYVRYLGDLSGGQILKPLLARTLGLSAIQLSFYDFPAIPDIKAAKARIWSALDSLDPASATAETILTEAVAGFRHNIALSSALAVPA